MWPWITRPLKWVGEDPNTGPTPKCSIFIYAYVQSSKMLGLSHGKDSYHSVELNFSLQGCAGGCGLTLTLGLGRTESGPPKDGSQGSLQAGKQRMMNLWRLMSLCDWLDMPRYDWMTSGIPDLVDKDWRVVLSVANDVASGEQWMILDGLRQSVTLLENSAFARLDMARNGGCSSHVPALRDTSQMKIGSQGR